MLASSSIVASMIPRTTGSPRTRARGFDFRLVERVRGIRLVNILAPILNATYCCIVAHAPVRNFEPPRIFSSPDEASLGSRNGIPKILYYVLPNVR